MAPVTRSHVSLATVNVRRTREFTSASSNSTHWSACTRSTGTLTTVLHVRSLVEQIEHHVALDHCERSASSVTPRYTLPHVLYSGCPIEVLSTLLRPHNRVLSPVSAHAPPAMPFLNGRLLYLTLRLEPQKSVLTTVETSGERHLLRDTSRERDDYW